MNRHFCAINPSGRAPSGRNAFVASVTQGYALG
jgi:hypothetical protein